MKQNNQPEQKKVRVTKKQIIKRARKSRETIKKKSQNIKGDNKEKINCSECENIREVLLLLGTIIQLNK